MKKPITNKRAAERLATIRRQNVQRHHKAAATTKLRGEIQRHTSNRNMQMELGRLQEALACYDKVIELNHENAEAWHGRGLTMKLLGKDEAAVNGALQNAKDYGYEE